MHERGGEKQKHRQRRGGCEGCQPWGGWKAGARLGGEELNPQNRGHAS